MVVVGGGRWWWVVVGGGGGMPLDATGGHRGQFLRTDFGPCLESTPLPTPPGPLKLRLIGD